MARGALVGLALFGAYIVQTIGLQYTTGGQERVSDDDLRAACAVWLRAAVSPEAAKGNLIAAALDARRHRAFVAGWAGRGLNVGDLLTLACGFLFAAHIIAVEQCQKKTNTYALIVLQFAFCGLYAAVYSLTFERGMPMTFSRAPSAGCCISRCFPPPSA